MNTNFNLIRRLTLAAAVAVVTIVGLTVNAEDSSKPMKPMKGSEHLNMLQGLDTKEAADALKTGDTLAMVCAKCKTVWTTRIKQGAHGAQVLNERGQPTELIGTHTCKGCNSTLTVVGHAKGDITELKHTCGACGTESAFCCATKSGEGKTKGMEK